jgi:hypothetical protein
MLEVDLVAEITQAPDEAADGLEFGGTIFAVALSSLPLRSPPARSSAAAGAGDECRARGLEFPLPRRRERSRIATDSPGVCRMSFLSNLFDLFFDLSYKRRRWRLPGRTARRSAREVREGTMALRWQ